jgi:hypothetical protein
VSAIANYTFLHTAKLHKNAAFCLKISKIFTLQLPIIAFGRALGAHTLPWLRCPTFGLHTGVPAWQFHISATSPADNVNKNCFLAFFIINIVFLS